MLVPVHTRGQIQLPGAKVKAAAAPASGTCRGADGHCHRKAKQPAKPADDDGGAKDRDNCAVCHFILGLNAPPPVTVVEARLGLVRDVPVEHTLTFLPRHAALPFHGLDPPAV